MKVRQLLQEMLKLETKPLSEDYIHTVPKTLISQVLNKCTEVWLRLTEWDTHWRPFYAGLFKVLKQTEKYFTIEFHSGKQTD